ncbi:bifunctional folylpolyglutamate synthase/dihydrofolate synthase [Synoicihabitans lomoniglobus]|uniref:tetrahydrofolate synthase n=1 Tax=Synoicihabitans lomoniglobus TaxID=2909285 RepID=A0AAF0CQQ4_9BACT|nr:bifunctional folylpolyglutamate synthase/dihydrofolate synthase [Opitutaceae bacterium LMO-M01]WED66320.1 bifunctional folylpolyglutamate synthase/dihydrofolate synthase [Opitutaceae bacterium LMO-M01]
MDRLNGLDTYPAVQDYLFSLKAKGVKFGIDRMQVLAAEIGHPERAVPIIHLAGTNGKGSTAAMLDAILRASGQRVGLYTSPHLVRLGERVQVDREILTEAEIMAFTRQLIPVADRLGTRGEDDHPSFFEFMTAMAFMQFARRECDIAVAEVGLGGELDATNIVQPIVTAITSIGFDHCEILGHTHAEIARAKAGIIKPGVPVVIGRMPAEAEAVVRARAVALDCPIHSVRETFESPGASYPETALEGDCQRWNAGTATLVARALPASFGVSKNTITTGLAAAQWPARWQRIPWGDNTLIIDASHNPEGAESLARNLVRLIAEIGEKPTIVVGALGVARAGALMSVISQYAAEIHLVVPNQARSCSHAALRELIPGDFTGEVFDDDVATLFSAHGMRQARRSGRSMVVTGSIYLAGEVMAQLNPETGPGEGRLQDF